jgi:alkylation response protein AidB-like acyl-CoA dehydrogenase
LKERGLKMSKESAMAKYYASEVSQLQFQMKRFKSSVVTVIQKTFPVEKFYRDSKLCTIGEGTSEIQKLVISREILK